MILFKKRKIGDLYACLMGDHVGKFFIIVEKHKDKFGVLAVPTMENLWIPRDKFDFGLDNGIIEYVERVPKEVRKTSEAKFKENEEISGTSD